MKRKALLLLLLLPLLLLLGALFWRFGLAGTRYTVLEYHNFTEAPEEATDYTMTVSALRRDLDWLHANGYETILPRELAAGVRDDGSALPKKVVLLTFDDGYTSNYTLAFPILKEYGAKATVSLITAYIDGGKPGFLSWEQCREMAESGLVEFASHTHDFHSGDGIGIGRIAEETQQAYEARVFPDLEMSIARIEAELGQPPTAFTYPFGNMDEWAESFLQEHFAVTLSGVYGRARHGEPLYRLPRCNVSDQYAASKYVR